MFLIAIHFFKEFYSAPGFGSRSRWEPGYLARSGAGAVTLARLWLRLNFQPHNSRKLATIYTGTSVTSCFIHILTHQKMFKQNMSFGAGAGSRKKIPLGRTKTGRLRNSAIPHSVILRGLGMCVAHW